MSSTTAERWWVRLAARWLARVEAVSPMIRMAMLTLTGLSTAVVALKSYGYGQFALQFVGVLGLGGLAFTWAYTEGGVFNQQRRDYSDLGDNYSGPTMLFDAKIDARQRAEQTIALLEALTGDPVTDEQRRDIHNRFQQETVAEWSELRDGVDVEAVES